MIHNDLPQRGPVEQSPLQPRGPATRRRSSPELLTRTRRTSGRSDSRGKPLSLRARIPVFAGRITRLNRTTAAGTESNANHNYNWHDSIHDRWAILAGMIRQSLVTISSMAAIPRAQRSATMAAPTRSGWRPAQSGSVAVTWTREMAHQPGTSSAWNSSLRLTHSTARRTKATRPKRPILPINSWGCPAFGGLHCRRRVASSC